MEWLTGGGNTAFIHVLSTLQAVSFTGQTGCKGELLNFLWFGLWQSLRLNRSAGHGGHCKHSRLAACLPAGSWGTIEMHSLVDVQMCPCITYLMAVFSELILSQHFGTPPGRYILLNFIGLSLSMQGSCWSDWLFYCLRGKALTFSLISLVWMVIDCFPSSSLVYHGHHLIL